LHGLGSGKRSARLEFPDRNQGHRTAANFCREYAFRFSAENLKVSEPANLHDLVWANVRRLEFSDRNQGQRTPANFAANSIQIFGRKSERVESGDFADGPTVEPARVGSKFQQKATSASLMLAPVAADLSG
jgi:hypothetical protein